MIGLAQGAFDKAVSYAFQRKQFGRPVGEFQGMSFQFAEVATEIEAAKLLTYNAARRFVLRVSWSLASIILSGLIFTCLTGRRKASHSRRRRPWQNTIAPLLLRRPLALRSSGQGDWASRERLVSKNTGGTRRS